MADTEKKTECVKVWMSEKLFKEISREAAADDRKLSDFMCLVLDRWLNGNKRQRDLEGLERAE